MIAALLATLLGASASGTPPVAPLDTPIALASVPQPNVVVVVLDDIGCETLEAYAMGAPYAQTPNLTSFAARGLRFSNFYANPLCAPTRALLETGRYAFRTGFGPNILPGYQFDLNQAETCIPEMVRDGFGPGNRPYVSAVFGKWHLSTYANTTHPNQSGFDHFAGLIGNIRDEGPVFNTTYDHYHWRHVDDGITTVLGTPSGPYDETNWSGSVTAREAAAWMRAQVKPFFSVVSFIPPHLPYQVPPATLLSPATIAALADLGQDQIQRDYVAGDLASPDDLTHPLQPLTPRQLGRKNRLFYQAMVEATDANFGQFLAALEQKRDDTLIIVIGDNGTEASAVDITRYDQRRAKRTCYQLGVRTPCFVAGPLVDAPGRVVTDPVGAVDVWRTVRDITGARELPGMIPAGLYIDSVSFLPLITDAQAHGARKYAFSEIFTPIGNPAWAPMGTLQRMITDGKWKLIRTGAPGVEELYRIDQDPMEQLNLLPAPSIQVQRRYDELRAELDRLILSPG